MMCLIYTNIIWLDNLNTHMHMIVLKKQRNYILGLQMCLLNEVQKYIEQIAPSSNLRGYAIVEECEKYDVDIFVLYLHKEK